MLLTHFGKKGTEERLLVRDSSWQILPPSVVCQGVGVGMCKWPSRYSTRVEQT